MAWGYSSQDMFAILSQRAPELSARLGGRVGTFKRQTGQVPTVYIHCEDVTVECYLERDLRTLISAIVFPCERFGTHQNDVCETSTHLLFEVLKYGYKLEPPPATPLTRKDGLVIDALDVQFTVLFEELEFLAAHLLFDQHRRDLAAAYASGYRSGYTYVYSGRAD